MAELSKKTTFLDLNVDCLLKVFDYCSDRDLFSLWRVHNSLRDIVELCIAKKKSQLILLANPASKILEQRYFHSFYGFYYYRKIHTFLSHLSILLFSYLF